MNGIVYIVDDDDGIRTSLSWLLGSIKIVSRPVESVEEFLQAYDSNIPACVVLDVRMPERSGFELQSELRDRGILIPIIFMSAHGDIPMSVRAMQNGASDFVEKPYNAQFMLEKIQLALRKAIDQHDVLKQRLALKKKLNSLTPREREVLNAVVEGKPNKVIATQLSISVKTVQVHRSAVREKLGATRSIALIKDILTLGI